MVPPDSSWEDGIAALVDECLSAQDETVEDFSRPFRVPTPPMTPSSVHPSMTSSGSACPYYSPPPQYTQYHYQDRFPSPPMQELQQPWDESAREEKRRRRGRHERKSGKTAQPCRRRIWTSATFTPEGSIQEGVFNPYNQEFTLSPDYEPQMNTPDDPVIHSPPSIRPPGSLMSAPSTQTLPLSGSGSSPTPMDDADAESRRRQKTCRVCGDHATGYNFNVITCESCKAFFRRNALRPKEFKCPYSEDCEINSVSRRFCQKCRLRKCFTVGMKKEWILNEEQLRRRKNSRLNNMNTKLNQVAMAGSSSSPHSVKSPQTPGSNASSDLQNSSPLMSASITPLSLTGRRSTIDLLPQHIGTGGSHQYSMISPNSVMCESPPTRSMSMLGMSTECTGDSYEPNMLLQQRTPQSPHLVSSAMSKPFSPPRMGLPQSPDPPGVAFDHTKKQVVMPVEIYNDLLKRAGTPADHHSHASGDIMSVHEQSKCFPPSFGIQMEGSGLTTPHSSATETGFGPRTSEPTYTDLNGGQGMHMEAEGLPGSSRGNPTEQQMRHFAAIQEQIRATVTSSSSLPFTSASSSSSSMARQERMNTFFDRTIRDELNAESPDYPPCESKALHMPLVGGVSKVPAKFALSQPDLNELDVIREAFVCMNEPMEPGPCRQREAFTKEEKRPADIMNIMDITMRRLVKMAKRVPAFNELEQDAKFALLKGGMVEMLTVRGVTRFDKEQKCWRTPILPRQYNVSFEMFNQLNAEIRDIQKDRFLQFFQMLHEDLRTNELAIELLMLVVLFTPRDTITHEPDKTIIEQYHQQYRGLLLRYLSSLYGEETEHFNAILPKALSLLAVISINAASLFLGTVNPEDAEPLPREFFKVTQD